MKMLNSSSPSANMWGRPLMSGFQLHFVPLFTTLEAQQFSQFLIHLTVHLSSLYFIDLSTKDVMGHSAESLTNIRNEHALIHTASHVIIEGNQAY